MDPEKHVPTQKGHWLYSPRFPDTWRVWSLHDLASWTNGMAFRNIHFSTAGRPVIKIAELKNGITAQTAFTASHYDTRLLVGPGDMLFSWSGQPETSIDAFWWQGPEGWLNQHIFKVTAHQRICSQQFLYFLLKYLRPNFIGIARNKQTTGLGHVTKKDMERIKVRVPRPSTQAAICDILKPLDDKIELNRRMNETLEGMARAIFKSWFVDFLPVRAKIAAKENDPALLLPQAEANTWYVYAIECNDGSLYIGQTQDLRQRWAQHVGGRGGKWTKQHPPVRVPYWERQASREAAVQREKWLKTGFGRKWLKKHIAASTRTQTGDPVRAKAEGRQPPAMDPATAALFPDSLQDSELGKIPKGWRVMPIGQVCEFAYGKGLRSDARRPGSVPVFGSNGQVGWHDEPLVQGPGVIVGRKGNPGIVTWAPTDFFPIDTTFFVVPLGQVDSMHFLFHALSAAALPGLAADSAVPGLNRNIAYMTELIVPPAEVVRALDGCLGILRAKVTANDEESRTLAAIRDALLPKLLSGEIRVKDAEELAQEAI